ncbi:S9 family peptidase [Archangium sp.]|uniref:S9 family peptidase n=1 Tax=Archangium sp. TaxID=1872627 RepID=UPI002D43BC3C|nr:S9 family peptidase [Archangium sp.]HYO51358.1 S9 family peptidase [Archangium sp.]
MRMKLLLAAAWLVLAPAAQAQTTAVSEAPSLLFEARDLFALEQAGDPRVHPDGKAVAYVRSTGDVMTDRMRPSIWLVDVDTGAQRPVVAGPGAHRMPRWSPDGRRLAYVSTGEEGRPQLFVRWMDSGATARVANLPEAPEAIAWSPDGRHLAFTMFAPGEGPKLGALPPKPEGATWAEPLKIVDTPRYRTDAGGYLKPGYTHVYMVSAEGGSPRQLTFGKFNDAGPLSWSPDSRRIVYSANREAGWERKALEFNSELYEVSVVDGTVRALTSRRGPDTEPVLSPDGSRLAYTGFDDRRVGFQNAELYVADQDGRNPRSLTRGLDRSVQAPRWAADGRSIYVQYVDQGTTRLGRVSLEGRMTPVVEGLGGGPLDRPYSGGAFDVGGGVIAYTKADPARPADLVILRGGKAMQVTRLNDDLFMGKRVGRVEPLEVRSSIDQRPVGAWMVLPPDFDPSRKYPLILEIHGGPFSSYGPRFATDMQLYAAAGYVVLYTNPRGSTSYGETFANFIDKNYPGPDYDDLMSAVDAAIAKGFVDPQNLFVTGGSGGGILTAWIVGKTDRFRAAAVQKPVVNWTAQTLTSDIPTVVVGYWFEKKPWEDPEGYWKRSPLSLVGNVKTPTLVVVGEKDYRTPASEAEQYYQALQMEEVPTALVVVPGASHENITARPSHSAAKAGAILAWFDRYRSQPTR